MHPWPNKIRVGWLCRCVGLVWKPIRKRAHAHSSRNTRPQSSQLAEPLWTDLGQRIGISVRDPVSTSREIKEEEEEKERRQGMNGRTFSPNRRTRGKSSSTTTERYTFCKLQALIVRSSLESTGKRPRITPVGGGGGWRGGVGVRTW